MKKWLFFLFVFCLIYGCFSKKELKYNWPIYQIEETKKDTSGVELKVVFYEYYRQTKKEEIVFFAEKIFKESIFKTNTPTKQPKDMPRLF